MGVTSGFFNSLNHDRRYNAQQFSALFDGIINDGVFANIGAAFAIKADTGVTVTIDKGKAWFNSAWVYNDAILPLTFEASEVVLDRIDAVVIEVDHSEAVRLGDIKIVKGTPSSSPQRPTMANTANKHQYPLAYIYRKAGSTVINQADITNMVGTSSCPYITGILQVQNIDNIVAQWEGQWNQWYAEKVSETDSDASVLLADMKSAFDIWFADVQALLDDDVATALAGKVAELQGKFDDLAREGAVYDTLEDSELDIILGSDGTPIQGKTVFGGNGSINGPIDAATLQGKTPADFRPAGWMPTAEEVGARPADWMPTAEEVGARPADWIPSAADVKAAPAGYGLANDFATVTTVANLNKQTKNGWVRYSNASASLVSGFKAFYALVRIDSYTNNVGYEYCTQTAYITNESTLNGAILQRHCLYGAWSPWEWENPPMQTGVEYRTTKRVAGNAVYTKRFSFGNLPKATSKRVQIPNYTYTNSMVSARFFIEHSTSDNAMQLAYGADPGFFVEQQSGNVINIVVNTTGDFSAYSGYVTIEYTK